MEPVVEVCGLSCILGDFQLDSVDLQIFKNEYLVILGPTGSGKTVFLESLLGLQKISAGTVFLDGIDITYHLPEERNVGYIPQDYALFPNMTVADNIAYGPSVRKMDLVETREKVSSLMDMLHISHLSTRYPDTLSGGEKQRVAVGRALAVEPKVLLLDEPLAALDETRRLELTSEFKRIQRQSGATFVHVCHNLDEAFEVADRIAILASGKIIQAGSINDILDFPHSEFIARFTGAKNIFSLPHAQACGLTVPKAESSKLDSKEAFVVVRPESISVVDCKLTGSSGNGNGNILTGKVQRIVRKVSISEVYVKVRGGDISTVWVLLLSIDSLIKTAVDEELSFFVPSAKVKIISS